MTARQDKARIYLRKGNLVVRAAATEDARILCQWWNDGVVMAHAGFPMGLHTTEEEKILCGSVDNHIFV